MTRTKEVGKVEVLDPRSLAVATPEDRDRVVDLVRVAAIGVVVLGHWLLAVVVWEDGQLHGRNLLQVAPWARWATWLLQVMPLFFVVGGVANSASWASARRRSVGFPAWVHGRLDRLVRPVAALAITWTVALALAAALGADPAMLRTAARLVAMPVWFLAVYLAVVAVTPVMVALHQRFGLKVPIALAAAAGICDLASGPLAVPAVGWANFGFVWLFAHQLGFAWRDGGLERRRTAWLLAGVGVVGLVLLTGPLGYPTSMVGGPGERSNNTPPTVALLALTVAQTGVLILARRRLAAWAERPGIWRTVVTANAMAMTIYLWHLTALCVATLVLLATGLLPQPEPATAGWWSFRPPWLLALAAFLVPIVACAARVEARVRPAHSSRVGRGAILQSAAGVAAASAGLTAVSIGGFPVLGRPLVVPVLGLTLLMAGVVLVRGTLLRELRPRAQHRGAASLRGRGGPSARVQRRRGGPSPARSAPRPALRAGPRPFRRPQGERARPGSGAASCDAGRTRPAPG